MSKIILKLTDICKDYRQGRSIVEVLKSINLKVAAGELIAIVGASGCGKSTLLHIAGLLDSAGQGQVSISYDDKQYVTDGKSLNSRFVDGIRLKHLGFIYQYHHLLKDFSARENVALPKLIAGCDAQSALTAADELLSELGLAQRRFNMPGELSGGEQQRVAIARSLINKPQLVLADEPTGNLDPETAEEVFQMFLQLAKNHGTCVIMVTHNHMLAEKMHKTYELRYGVLKPL